MFHLPVRGSGDGGIYSTAADISAFWQSLFAGKIVSSRLGGRNGAAPQRRPSESMRYGLGFWLGSDERHRHSGGIRRRRLIPERARPEVSVTHTVISNSSDGAWPITRPPDELPSRLTSRPAVAIKAPAISPASIFTPSAEEGIAGQPIYADCS